MNLSQPGHMAKLFKHFNLSEETVHHPSTPMALDIDLGALKTMTEIPLDSDSPGCEITLYRSALGLFIFLLRTRPDIAFAINFLAQRTEYCTEQDYQALKRIARYLHGTQHKVLRFRCGNRLSMNGMTTLYALSLIHI